MGRLRVELFAFCLGENDFVYSGYEKITSSKNQLEEPFIYFVEEFNYLIFEFQQI